MPQPFYITTPIFYVNGDPHIGHAYTVIAADVLARFKRLDGFDVHFLSGTDEHGQKVEKAARDAGLEPQAFTDEISARFRDMEARLGASTDDFITRAGTRFATRIFIAPTISPRCLTAPRLRRRARRWSG